MTAINPAMLRWARESASLSLADASRAVGVAEPRLAEMEAGKVSPTRRQLNAMAGKYRRSLLTFYLPEPPAPSTGTHDFRTLPERTPDSEARVDALVRDLRVRQGMVVDALEDLEEAIELPFVGSARVEQGPDLVARNMMAILDFDLAQYRRKRTVDDAFALLREAVERVGVYVVLMGNLGHHTTNISPQTFRGIALANPVAPFIVINENDSRAAWSFTLLHELAHVFLGQSGISGYDGEARVERVCDQVAARFLLGPDELQELPAAGLSTDELVAKIGEFADARRVSGKMVAYNLRDRGQITWEVYHLLSERFDADRRKGPSDKEKSGAPDYYVVRRHRIGGGLNRLVARLVASGVMSSGRAGRVLGVKPTAVGRMTAERRAA